MIGKTSLWIRELGIDSPHPNELQKKRINLK